MTIKIKFSRGKYMENERYINAYDFAEIIENLDIAVAGKPARWNDAKYTVLKEIAEAPDADVIEVKHGEWVYFPIVSTYEGTKSGYSCSECKSFVDEELFENIYTGFCGNCGAKMKGGVE